jgi:hypothetical protein
MVFSYTAPTIRIELIPRGLEALVLPLHQVGIPGEPGWQLGVCLPVCGVRLRERSLTVVGSAYPFALL